MLAPDQIAANLAAVERRIESACARAGRKRSEMTLVAVSKTFPAAAVEAALAAGIREVGENRVQEARDKKPLVAAAARWHLIGHLQSNKAKDAVKIFDVIQTIDSIELAEKVARAAASAGRRPSVMIEVNLGGEAQKAGCSSGDVVAIADAIRAMPQLELSGLMTIPPADGEPRRWFAALRALRDTAGVEHLSMGMSEDFEAAIEEGATIIRVGRAIFGSRG